jgi:dTDP-4-amino-4,6-dideoxygalactose transaminase
MTDIAAALGLCQLPRLAKWLARRQEIWARYDEAFADLPCWTPTQQEPQTLHARHLYTLLLDIDSLALTRDDFMVALHGQGIGTGVHYRSLHLHHYYRERFGFQPHDFPNAAWISDRTVSLPLSAKLTDREVERIIQAVRKVLTDAAKKQHKTLPQAASDRPGGMAKGPVHDIRG